MIGKIIVLTALLLSATIVQAGQFGSISPAAKPGQISQEIGFFASRGTWEASDMAFEDAEISQNEVYVQAGYGLSDNWESYFRVGGADFKIKNPVPDEFVVGEDFDVKDGMRPFASLGIRGILYRGSFFNIGSFAQGSYFYRYEDTKTAPVAGVTTELNMEFDDHWEVNAGAAVEVEWRGIGLYAGPVLYFSRGKLKFEGKAAGITESRSSTYEEEGNIGGFAGLTVSVARFGSLCFEGQYKSEISAGGAFVYLRHTY